MNRDCSVGAGARRRMLSRASTLAVVAASVFLIAGCGGSSSSSGPNKAKFCADNAKLDKATASASSASSVIKDLKNDQSTLSDAAKTAPAAIKSQAEVLVNASDKAIKSGDTSGFNQKFANAGMAVDKYCGQS